MLLATLADLTMDEDHKLRALADFAGNPTIAFSSRCSLAIGRWACVADSAPDNC
jgi:hypothetical protein